MKTRGKLFWAAAATVVLIARPVLATSEVQLRWSELAPAVSGKTVTVVLRGGPLLYGKILSVGPEALSMQVKSASYAGPYQKGRGPVPRSSVAAIELTKTNVLRKVFIGVGVGVGSAVVAAALMFVGAASHDSTSKDEDPKVTTRKLKVTLIFIGALAVAVGTKFGIDAARGKGSTTVMTIRVIPEPE